MKKIYLIALAAFVGTAVMAQVSVTFQVDMNGQTVAPEGVFVAGDWQDGLEGEDTGNGDWNGTSHPMTDMGDGIYSLTAEVEPGQYQFKYINGGAWEENPPAVSIVGGGNTNRFFAVSSWHADNGGLSLPAIEFLGSAPAGKVAVRLQIDMANQTVGENGVHVAGDIITPNWEPGFGTAYNYSGSRYAFVTYPDPSSSYEYKFINGNDWADSPENAPIECGIIGGNRLIEIGTEDVITDAYCFGTCELCSQPTEVTLRVDLSFEGGGNPEGVSVAGAFQDWTPGATLLTDIGNDIYEVTVMMEQGPQPFKFINGIEGWDDEESIPAACNVGGNREIIVGEDPMEFTVCFSQCTEECVSNPDPAEITFRVDMNQVDEVSEEGVWVMGDFTTPNWQPGAIEMSDDDGDGVYEVTVLISGAASRVYKYANGDPLTAEETHDFLTDGCGVSNGIGGWNRVHVRSGSPETLNAYFYNSCEVSISNTNNVDLGEVTVFPNPTSDVTYIDIENPNRHTLRMSIVDITGKTVRENILINSSRVEINTSNLNAGLYFLNVTNERSERAVYKLMVK